MKAQGSKAGYITRSCTKVLTLVAFRMLKRYVYGSFGVLKFVDIQYGGKAARVSAGKAIYKRGVWSGHPSEAASVNYLGVMNPDNLGLRGRSGASLFGERVPEQRVVDNVSPLDGASTANEGSHSERAL